MCNTNPVMPEEVDEDKYVCANCGLGMDHLKEHFEQYKIESKNILCKECIFLD